MPNFPKVQMQIPCERCNGSGRLAWAPPAGGYVVGDATQTCPDCIGKGSFQVAVPLPEFKKLLNSNN